MNKLIKSDEVKEKPFPKLMKSEDLYVFFFDKSGAGTVLYNESEFWEVGEYCGCWNMSKFKDTNDKISINED